MSIRTLALVLVFTLTVLFAPAALAQEDTPSPRASPRGFGGPSVGLTVVDAGARPITGGRGGVLIADTFALAGVVSGTAVLDELRPGDQVFSGLGYLSFGVEASYAFLPGRLFRPRIGLMLGAVYLEQNRAGARRREGYGFALEPHVAVELRASAIVRCTLVLGARVITGSKLELARWDRFAPTLSVQVEFGTPSSEDRGL
jgi:hypothetical protein